MKQLPFENVLFLDIDGVVNNKFTQQRHRGFIGIDPYLAFLVGRIVDRTGVGVVLSSSWRHTEDGREEVRKQVCKFFDVTPSISNPELIEPGTVSYVKRGYQIQAWLRKHPEVKRYAILDDDSDMLDEQMPNFFKTSWAVGITEEIADKVIAHFEN